MEKEYIKHLQQVKKVGTKLYIDDLHDVVPVGTILYTASPTPPNGYLICNGATVGRGTYPDLFAAIGTTYGDGDGSTTFQLPNLMDKTVWGGTGVGTEKEAGLPNIVGAMRIGDMPGQNWPSGTWLTDNAGNPLLPNNAFGYESEQGTVQTSNTYIDNGPYGTGISLKASQSNPIYGNSDTVQPPATVLLPVIKAFGHIANPGDLDAAKLAQDMLGYLPLSGGTMTGPIEVLGRNIGGIDPNVAITMNDDDKEIAVVSGHGAAIFLHGNNTAATAEGDGAASGSFAIHARKNGGMEGEIIHTLVGFPDGRLAWDGYPMEWLLESEYVDEPGLWHYRYYKYSNGLLIYHGHVIIQGGNTHQVVGLTIPYLTEEYRVLSQAETLVGDVLTCTGNRSTTWVDIHRRRCTDLGYNFTVGVDFTITGVWKRPFNQ